MKKDWEIKKQNLEGRTPSTCEAGVSPLQTTPLPQHALKAGWEIKKLGDVCEFLDSRRKPITANKRIKGEIPYYGATGILDYVADFLFDEELILLGEDGAKWGPGDKSAFRISGKTWVNNHAHVLKSSNMNYDWIIYYLNYSDLMKFVKGATVPKLNQENAKNISIPVPPLEEQKRIVKILDEKFTQLETIKANAQTNLQNAKDLFQSQLAKAFSNTTWEKAKLEDIALDFSRGKSKHRPRNDKCLFGGNYPFIQTGDIRNADKYVTDYSETYNETGLTQSKLWPEGTLCITIAANIAETAILSFPCCFPDSVIGFIPNEKRTTVDFVYYLIQFFKSELQKLSKGAAQDNLNLAKFENMNFPLPPLPEQKRIVKELDTLSEKVKALCTIYENQIADCDELKQSYLCKAFAGEL